MEHLLHELPKDTDDQESRDDVESSQSPTDAFAWEDIDGDADDRAPLLTRHDSDFAQQFRPPRRDGPSSSNTYAGNSDVSGLEDIDDPTKPLAGLNALEIAAVASAKRFLSQRLVQKVVQDIWDGNIIFWESLSVNAVKKARVYNKR